MNTCICVARFFLWVPDPCPVHGASFDPTIDWPERPAKNEPTVTAAEAERLAASAAEIALAAEAWAEGTIRGEVSHERTNRRTPR